MRVIRLPFVRRGLILLLTPQEEKALKEIRDWFKPRRQESAIGWAIAFIYYLLKELKGGAELVIRYSEDIEEVFDPDIAFEEILERFKKEESDE